MYIGLYICMMFNKQLSCLLITLNWASHLTHYWEGPRKDCSAPQPLLCLQTWEGPRKDYSALQPLLCLQTLPASLKLLARPYSGVRLLLLNQTSVESQRNSMTLIGNFIQCEEDLFDPQTLCHFSNSQTLYCQVQLRPPETVCGSLLGIPLKSEPYLLMHPWGTPRVTGHQLKDCLQASTGQKTKVFWLQGLFSFVLCVQWEELHIYAVIAGIIVYDEWTIQINFSFTPTII